MNTDNKHERAIVMALIRCTIAKGLNHATRHQITRLMDYYMSIGEIELCKQIGEMFLPVNPDDNFKIVQS